MDKVPDKQRKVLGKGLSALLPARPAAAAVALAPAKEAQADGPVMAQIPIALIDPNPLQPRTVFDSARIEELSASIKANGLIQPLIVRRKADRYELVAGERRLRASKMAGFAEVPALVQDYADERILEVALVENIQREDLNPMETAQALDRLGRELNLNHEEIGRRTGKDRTTVANLIRLLKLPEAVQLLLAEHRLSMGHARAILGLPSPEEQTQMAERSAAQGLSVRQVERMVQDRNQRRESGTDAKKPARVDPNVSSAVHDLEAVLGTRVRITEKQHERGTIEIEYYSVDDLNRLYDLLMSAGPKS